MYELNGEEVTLEFLQGKAQEYSMDIDSYLEAMKSKGLVEKTNGSQIEDATAGPEDMASKQDATLSVLPPQFQNVIIDVPDLSEEEFESIVNEESKASEERKKIAAEKTKQYKRQLKIEETTGLKPDDYPSLIIGEEDQSYMGRVIKVPVQEKANMDKMEGIISDVSSEFMDQFAPMLSNEFKALENYQSDPMKYANQLKEIENKAYANISKKYPGLSKKDFTNIASIGGSGLFQNVLNKQANTYNSKANQANLKGAETLDEDFYKSVIANEDSSRNAKELQKKELVENIIQKTRELQTTQEGPRARFLRFEIAQHKDDIQKLAIIEGTGPMGEFTGMFGEAEDTKDKVLASSYFENETTKYRRNKIKEAQQNFEGVKNLGLEQTKSSDPTMTDLQAIEKFLKSKVFELQQLQVAGNEETVSVDIEKTTGTRLYKDLKSIGLVKDGQTGKVDVPIKTIFDFGFDGRDFEPDEKYLLGSFDVMKNAMSEDDRLKLLNYEDAIYRTKGEISSLYDLRYLNNDPETLDRGGGVKSFLETTVKAVATHYTDLRMEEADKLAAMGKNETTAATLEKFEAIVPDFNETFKKEIANGEIDELGFTKEQMQAIEKTFGEEIGEGVGHFVPMLIDLGVLSAGTGMVMSIPKIASAMATLRGGTAYQKAQFHAIMAMIEEGKMFTVGMGAGTGAGFYAGGQLTSGVSPFKKRFKYFDPIWQRVIKGGVVGASSSQLATVMEAAVKDLMGDADFKASIDQHFGHLTTRDFIVESIVFSIVGASHLKKKDFMSTSGKYKALNELNKELRDVMPEGGIEKMTPEQKEKYGALLSAKNVIEQQIQVETNAVELDPNSKNFEKNYNARIVRPTENAVRQVIPEYKGFDVRFVEGKGELAEGNTAEFRYKEGKDGKDLIILDKNAYTPGKTAHELTHLVTENYFKRNPEAEVKFTKKMETLFKDFNFEAFEGTPLAEFIKEGYKIDARTKEGRSEAAREYLAYMTELLSDPKIYYQKVAPTFFKEAKQELLSIVEENFGYRPKVRNAKEFVELLGRFSKDQRMGLGFEMKAARLADLEEFDFLGIQFVENNKKKEKSILASQDLTRKKFLLEKEKGDASDMYRIDKFLFDENGNRKYKSKEEYQMSKDFDNVSKLIQDGIFDKLIRKTGNEAGIKNLDQYVAEVRDNLVMREYNFDPTEGGGSVFGYFSATAIPFEALRVREAFVKKMETGEVGTKVELDKEVGEGRVRFEVEAEKSYFEKDFENEDIGIAAQLKYREYLKEAGLNESEAEAYLPTGKGIDVAKKLKIEAPEINIDNIDLTSYKNIRKTANEQTGDKVATEYFNIKPELWSIMKSTPAKNLNKSARKSIQEKIEADVQTIIKLLPQGAQNLISERGENITPDVLKNTSTGNKKVLLQIPMLYTKTSRTGKNLAEYVKTPELIKYEKLFDPKRGTSEFDFKQSFENRFLAEFGIGENAFKGRNLDQRLKAIVSETIGSIHNQSVRKVMNDLLMPKSLINQAAAGKSSALASKTLEKLAGKKGGGDYITFLNEIKKESFSQLFGRNLRPPMDPEKGLAKTFIEYFTDYKKSGLGEFNISNEDLKNIAKEIHAQYKFGQVTPAVVLSKAVRAAEAPNKLENIEIQAGLEPSKFELNTPEDIVEARAATRVVTKALVEKYGDGVYENVLMRGESGGKGIGAYPDFANMMFGLGKGQNRFSLHESSIQAIDYHSDIKNSKGLKYTGPQKSLVEGQGNKKGQFARLIDKKTGEWSIKALNEAYEVGEFNKSMLKEAVKALREAYKAGDITYSQARAWIEIHGGPMSGLIKLSGSFAVAPNMSVKQMFDIYGSNPSDYVLEHTTPAQYVKAKIYDYVLNGTEAKKNAMDLTLADYHTTLIPEAFDVMVNKTLQTDLPSWHRPGMDPIASRYYEANHPSDFSFGLKNFKTGKVYSHQPNLNSSQKQKIKNQIKEANIKAFPKGLRKYAKTQLNSKNLENLKTLDKALELGRQKDKKSRGMSTFDFDETLIIDGKNFVTATKGEDSIKISSEKFPIDGPRLAEQGYKFDFSDFVNVEGGKEGPLMQKLKNQIEKYGVENVYILTARMQEAAPAIQAWLKTKGVELPIENITGLGNSTGEAKALWMLEKFSEGYNDMYFVDDALPNVKAVKNVLDQLDIKSNVQQALASKDLNKDINNIVEYSLDLPSNKKFTKAEAKVRGKDIKRRKFFIPDSAADLELLIEPLYGKGKKGTENKKWFEDNLIRPWERGINDFNTARQTITNDYMSLRKQNKDVVKKLPEAVPGTNFSHDTAIRIYIWNKAGYKIPDLAVQTQKTLVEYIRKNPNMQAFAESLAKLTKIEGGLKEPSNEWWGETIASEIQDLGAGIGRAKYIKEFVENKNEIFSEENLNKMEAKLGSNWRENIEDMFDRMETGRTRSMNLGKAGNALMNYLNGATAAIMNFNTRSATLQLISTVNFVNSSFNNPLKATQAFLNQKQYWKDFTYLMNSDMLKQRRAGLQINVSEAELAAAAAQSKNPARAVIAKILKAGYLPTQIADSFAIASGGATYYRNAIKKYLKEGLSQTEAEQRAFIDFQAIAERTQQSSRADLLSKQQTSFIGRVILPFANTPMQMNRIMMKDVLDISKGRYKGYYGENSLTSKLSRIGYYGFAQSAIFAGLQSGAFALMTNSDDDEKIAESKISMLNTTADSFLRGMGVSGAVVNGFRLAIQEFIKQDAKKYNADYSEVGEKLLNISPTIGSKFSKLDAAGNTYKWNKKLIKDEGLTINGPLMEASTKTIEALTNVPLGRYYTKGNNIQNALDDDFYNWQRILMGLGWGSWGLGEGKTRFVTKNKGRKDERKEYVTKEGLRRYEAEKKIEKREKEEKKAAQNRCVARTSSGRRCKNMVNKPKTRCYAHD